MLRKKGSSEYYNAQDLSSATKEDIQKVFPANPLFLLGHNIGVHVKCGKDWEKFSVLILWTAYYMISDTRRSHYQDDYHINIKADTPIQAVIAALHTGIKSGALDTAHGAKTLKNELVNIALDKNQLSLF